MEFGIFLLLYVKNSILKKKEIPNSKTQRYQLLLEFGI